MLIWILASGLVAQNQRRPWRSSTRPPESNDRGLRELTDEEIPPNLNFYAMDPLYNPDVVLGWAEERIEEKLDRGLLALSMEGGKVYLSWRMLKTDPANIAFNIYRSIANGDAIKLNTGPIKATTDFIDTNPPLERENAWFIKPVLDGREQAVSKRAELPANPPAQQYKSIKLKDDVRGVSIVGRIGPNRGTYKYDGYDGRTMWGTGYGHGGRFYLGDIDPNCPGMECAGGRHFYTAGGQKLDGPVPPQDFLVWWDADLLREICSRRRIYKWKGGVLSDIPGSVQQITDILGDWREEIVTYTSGELRIYSTIIPASDRRACLMQDPLYRNDVTHRSMGYSHYPMTSYNLGVSSGGSAKAALAIGKVKETYAR